MQSTRKLKKIYYYDQLHYYYTGEGVHQEGEGIYLPKFCTTIEPPACPPGYVPFFNSEKNNWEQIPIPDNFIEIIRVYADYDFDKTHSISEQPLIYKIQNSNFLADPSVIKIFNLLSPLKKFDRYISRDQIAFSLTHRIVYTNSKIDNIYHCHAKNLRNFSTKHFAHMGTLIFPNFELANILHNIKKILDTIVISTYLSTQNDIFILENNDEIKLDAIGTVINKATSPTYTAVRDIIRFDHYRDLFRAINDIHNAYKHSILTECLYNKIHLEPTFHVRNFSPFKLKNLNKIIEYEIQLKKIIFSFNDFLSCLFGEIYTSDAPRFELIEISNKKR